METILNGANFSEEVLRSSLPVLVDFWAEWCAPCRVIGPAVASLARKYEGTLKVCKVNVDDAPDIAERYGIMSIPTLVIFKSGTAVDRITGALPAHVIERTLTSHL